VLGGSADRDGQHDAEREQQAMPAQQAQELLRSEQPTRQTQRPPPMAPAPSVDDFDFENEATPAGAAPAVPAGQRFSDFDEDTAPGGHQAPSQVAPGTPKKPSKSTGKTANLDVDMLQDLARIPTNAEEEVIFVDDE
jgi:hypothetical protein